MELQIEEWGSHKRVQVQAERIDMFSAPKMIKELYLLTENQANKNIVLNISSCSYCDASGLSAIVALHNMCEESGGMLIITGVQANNKKLIKTCMLDLEWNFAIDINEAESLMEKRDENELIPFVLQEA